MGESDKNKIKFKEVLCIVQIRKYICCYLAWLLRMKRPGYDLTWHSIRHQWSSSRVRSDSITKHIDIHYPKCATLSISNEIAHLNKQTFIYSVSRHKQQLEAVPKITVTSVPTLRRTHSDQNPQTGHNIGETSSIHSELRTIISQLAFLTNHIWRQEKHENESQDWKFVAMVIDRLCLVVFTLIMIIFTGLTFIFAYDFYSLG